MPFSYAYRTASLPYLFQPRNITGGNGDDWIYGSYGHDRLQGGHGNDFLSGNAGVDFMDGGHGNDVLDGGADTDQMLGGAGYDVLYGGDGGDWISGDGGWNEGDWTGTWGDARDVLYGGAGRDTLIGNGGNDYLNGGTDGDTLWGGYGIDTFAIRAGDSFAQTGRADVILSWDAEDRITGARGGYGEFGAYVTNIEDAQWYANNYRASLPQDTGNVLIYNNATQTGYLLMDLDNDAYNTLESGVEIRDLRHSDFDATNIVLA
jgi:Ca2+-binding RTX toxin-like protein